MSGSQTVHSHVDLPHCQVHEQEHDVDRHADAKLKAGNDAVGVLGRRERGWGGGGKWAPGG